MTEVLVWSFSAYLVGSIAIAVLVSKSFGLPDPREMGSGNPGATNVLRTGHKKAAILTLIGDALKGFLIILFAQLFGYFDQFYLLALFLAVIVGHMFPIFFDFRGGKGVATFFGALFAWDIWSLTVAFSALITWLVSVKVLKYSSLAAIISVFLTPLYAWLWGYQDINIIAGLVVIGALITWRHKNNIKALIQKTETKA